MQIENPQISPVSGTIIRRIMADPKCWKQLPGQLIEAGFMPQAVPGLLEVLASRKKQGVGYPDAGGSDA